MTTPLMFNLLGFDGKAAEEMFLTTGQATERMASPNGQNINGFTPKTRITTQQGLIASEDLKVGQLVATRDHGLRPIRSIKHQMISAVDHFAPVRLRKNVLTGQERDLIISPNLRVLFQGYHAELLFGENKVLIAAKQLIDGMDVTQNEQPMVTYIHIIFDRPEIIFAEGAATENSTYQANSWPYQHR